MTTLLTAMIISWVITCICGINSMVIADRHNSGLLKDPYWGTTYSVDYATPKQKKIRRRDVKKANRWIVKSAIVSIVLTLIYAAFAS